MKIQPILLTLALCALSTAQISAQNNRNRWSDEAPEQTWSVGLAPFSVLLPSGKVNIRGEWAYAPNKSLSLLVGIPRSTKMPNLLENNFELTGEGKTVKNRYTSFGATLGKQVLPGKPCTPRLLPCPLCPLQPFFTGPNHPKR
jgi:hypothetical protein